MSPFSTPSSEHRFSIIESILFFYRRLSGFPSMSLKKKALNIDDIIIRITETPPRAEKFLVLK